MRSRSSSISSSSPPSPSSSLMRLHLLAEDVLALGLALVRRPSSEISFFTRRSSSWRLHHRRARARTRAFDVEGLEDLLLVGDARLLCGRFEAMRSASAPVSRTLSRMPAVSLGRFGMSASTSRVPSRRLAPSASSSTSRSSSSGMRSTFARMYGSSADVLRDPEAPEAVEDDRVVAGPEADDLHDAGDGADVVEVLEAGLVDVGVALADDRRRARARARADPRRGARCAGGRR